MTQNESAEPDKGNGKKTTFVQIRTPTTITIDGQTFTVFASYETDNDTGTQYPAKMGVKVSYVSRNPPTAKYETLSDYDPVRYKAISDQRYPSVLFPVMADYNQSCIDHNRVYSYEKVRA